MQKLLIFPFFIILLSGCELFEYHPYDLYLEDKYTNINKKNLAKLEETNKEQDTFRFIFMGDTHRFLDETRDFVNTVNKMTGISFVLHGGDMTDYGLKKEYMWTHDQMSRLKIPYMAILGNHDNLGSGQTLYQTIYGDLNFSFIYRNTKFICLNTNALEFDYSEAVPDFKFIRQSYSDSLSGEYKNSIVIMHVEPGDIEFNNNVDELFEQEIKKSKKLLLCLHAHRHKFVEEEYFNDGLLYVGCENIEKRSFLLFTITEDSYSYQLIHF